MFRQKELWMPHGGRTRKPWIHEDREGTWRMAITIQRWTLFGGGEGQKEGCVTIQVLDLERHEVASGEMWLFRLEYVRMKAM